MKKNLLIIVSIVLCLTLNMMFKPINVKADENDTNNDITLNEGNDNDDEDEKEELEGQNNVVQENDNLDEFDDEQEEAKDANSNTTGLRAVPADDTTTGENETPQEEPKEENTPTEPVTEDVPAEEPAEEDIHGGQVYDIQKVLVNIRKLDKDTQEDLAGAKLQLLDADKNVLDEWVSDGTAHVVELPDGTYYVHEVEAPEGYDLAEDEEFTVKVEIKDIDAGSDASVTPCPHYTGTQMYYVEIAGEKHEVYCINQNWDTPDDDSQYDGYLLNSNTIRDYTKQTTPVAIDDTNVNKGVMKTIDVSDKSLDDDELYDKLLTIIYHRNIAVKELSGKTITYAGYEIPLTYTNEEIRFITEVALKNYTNPGLAEIQCGKKASASLMAQLDAAGIQYKRYSNTKTYEYDENGNYLCYIKHNYRDFVYVPDAPIKSDIAVTRYGEGDSFGQMVAGHWNFFNRTDYLHPDAVAGQTDHNARDNQDERNTVARYYALYQFLISDENPHPLGMNLYIYSSQTTPADPANNNYDGKYQNLLGITGYFEEFEQQTQDVVVENTYSTETTSLKVTKVWEDQDDQDKVRPTQAIIHIYADGEEIETVTLNEENGWTYTLENLPVYNKAKKIEYTVSEQEIELYKAVIEGDIESGFTITNFYSPKGGDNPPPDDNPTTGDNIQQSIISLIISMSLLSGSVILKRYN